jgi:hypothetical protein
MSVHFHKICQYGFVHEQCRCAGPKTTIAILCPSELDQSHRLASGAASRTCHCDPDYGHVQDCPSWGI